MSADHRWNRVTTLVTAFTAVGALVFTGLSLRATQDQIGAPGPDRLRMHVGGVFALERIAMDSPRDQRTIVEVLSGFIHTSSPRQTPAPTPPPTWKPRSSCSPGARSSGRRASRS